MRIELANRDLELVAIDNYLISPETNLGEQVLMLCERDSRAPAQFEINGRNVVFIWSMDTDDNQIHQAMKALQWAGWKGPFGAYAASSSIAKYYAGENDYMVLLDCPLQPTALPVGWECTGVKEVSYD